MDRREFLQRSAAAGAAMALPAWARTARRSRPTVLCGGLRSCSTATLSLPAALAMRARGCLGYALRPVEASCDRLLRESRRRAEDRSLGSQRANPRRAALRRPQLCRLLERQRRRRCRRVAAPQVSVSGRAPPSARARASSASTTRLAKHGVTVPGGSCPTVGIAGLALGGGVGYSSRRFGTTADNLTRVQDRDRGRRAARLRRDASRGSLLGLPRRRRRELRHRHGAHVRNASRIDGVDVFDRMAVGAGCAALAAWQQFAPHAPDALFSVLDLIATGPSAPGARAHVVSAGQYFGPESDLASLLQPLTSVGAPIRVTTQTLGYLDAVVHWAGCRDAASCTEARSSFTAKSDYVAAPLPAAAIATLVGAVSARQATVGARSTSTRRAARSIACRRPRPRSSIAMRCSRSSTRASATPRARPGFRACTRRCGRMSQASRTRTTSTRSCERGPTRTTAPTCRASRP